MISRYDDLLKEKTGAEGWKKLEALNNPRINEFIGEFTTHCEPDSLYICDDSKEDEDHVRKTALSRGEEHLLALEGQTIHWDGYGDQARDKKNTKFMVYKENLERMKTLNSVEYEEGLREIMGIAKGIMKGKQAIVKFFCEGPAFSVFTRPCVQITDSWYVIHSEQILYRSAYEHFRKMENKDDFYRFIHSAGVLDENGCVVNLDKRRIYMDTQNNIVYSMNAQYAGNAVGLKKHSMRLAINESGRQDWLCEHMFVMGCLNEKKNRQTYFCGAYPSACGKTSTAMIPGEKIVGDDIAYFRNINGEFRAVNVEQGIFGIVKDVNSEDDPVIYENLKKGQELIFSNVLCGPDNKPYWLGMGEKTPDEGRNHSGPGWFEGKKDESGKEIPLGHPNSRYTMRLDYLDNFDEKGFHDPQGVLVEGILYGGRDSDTTVPVEESPDWEDGILLKACTLESETTSATLGAEGVRAHSPMANLDFVSYPLGEYLDNNIRFGKKVKQAPKIFSTNYFLRDEKKKFCTDKLAKKVWLHWAEGRIHGDYEAYETPTGKIPLYEDLKDLFKRYLDADYKKEDYEYQFTFRCRNWIAKLERGKEFFLKMDLNTPDYALTKWDDTVKKIRDAESRYGDLILPGRYKG